MSGFITEPLRSDENDARPTVRHEGSQYAQGQRHDRIPGGIIGANIITPDDGEDLGVESDISAGQKMLSAVSGSLLTSLLGRPFEQDYFCLRIYADRIK